MGIPRNAYAHRPRTITATWRMFSFAIGLKLFLAVIYWLHVYLMGNSTRGYHGDLILPAQSAVGKVKWWKCKGPGHAAGAECGYVIVPLDYLNVSAGTAKVALGRYQATKQPRKGTVLFNPGGPGGAGKPVATKLGPSFQNIIGPEWDFVGFDPRGIGETKPRVECFREPGAYRLFKSNTVLDRGFDVAPNLTDPRTRDHLIVQQQEAESLYKTQFELCGKTMGDAIRYMGTSTVSRDIDFITTALEGRDSLINFYGGSYGSILGAYLVNMFPDRVGRVVIDGIADPIAWSSIPSYKWYKQWLENTEDAYNLFLKGCSKLERRGQKFAHWPEPRTSSFLRSIDGSKILLEASTQNLFPFHMPKDQRYSLPVVLASYCSGPLQAPRFWPTVALAFSRAIQGDGAPLLALFAKDITRDLERSAVSCNDNMPFTAPSPKEVIDESLDLLKSVQRHAGLAVVTTEPDSGCQFWPVTPPERFHGPWNRTLRNPILIHSNIADPVTPLSSGQLIKRLLGNSSRLAIREGPGHTSFSMNSLCTAKITRNYFKNGTLPADGHICPVDVSPFAGPDAVRNFTDSDAVMLEHLTVVGSAMDRVRTGLQL